MMPLLRFTCCSRAAVLLLLMCSADGLTGLAGHHETTAPQAAQVGVWKKHEQNGQPSAWLLLLQLPALTGPWPALKVVFFFNMLSRVESTGSKRSTWSRPLLRLHSIQVSLFKHLDK
jgi:hypothetical protein